MEYEWQPVRPAHSIECVATVINYSEPLSEFLVKRIIRKAESLAPSGGLTERSDVRTFQIPALMPDAAHQIRSQFDGIAFQKLGQTTPQGRVLLEDLVVSRSELVYRKYDYNRWSDYASSLSALLLPLAEISADATTVRALRLEYLDRFIIEQRSPGCVKKLLRENPMVANHVFEAPDLWHSHTGKIDTIETDQLLTQINIDFVSALQAQAEMTGVHSVAITTGLERRYSQNELDVESKGVTYIADHLLDLHVKSKNLFKDILTPEMASRVGLGDVND